MTFIQSILLGAFQGVAEFLPISSSGHLLILKNLMNLEDVPLLYDILLHFATLIVVCIVFYKKIWELLKTFFKLITKKTTKADEKNISYIIIIIIATIITGMSGVLLKDVIPNNPIFVSSLFLVTGIILLATKLIEMTNVEKKEVVLNKKNGFRIGIILGFAQSIGILPGISRSGITVSASLFSKLNKSSAGDLSFLISIPAILGATLLDFKNFDQLSSGVSFSILLVGMISAAVVGLFSLIVLLKLIRSGKFYLFSIYLIPAGIIGIIYFTHFN